MVFDAHVPFVQAPELHDAEVDVPQAVIHCLQAHVLADERAADVDPLLAPSDAAVGADVVGPANSDSKLKQLERQGLGATPVA